MHKSTKYPKYSEGMKIRIKTQEQLDESRVVGAGGTAQRTGYNLGKVVTIDHVVEMASPSDYGYMYMFYDEEDIGILYAVFSDEIVPENTKKFDDKELKQAFV